MDIENTPHGIRKEDQCHGTTIMMIVDIIGNEGGATAGKKRETVRPTFMEVIDKATTVMLQKMLKTGNNRIGKRIEETKK